VESDRVTASALVNDRFASRRCGIASAALERADAQAHAARIAGKANQ